MAFAGRVSNRGLEREPAVDKDETLPWYATRCAIRSRYVLQNRWLALNSLIGWKGGCKASTWKDRLTAASSKAAVSQQALERTILEQQDLRGSMMPAASSTNPETQPSSSATLCRHQLSLVIHYISQSSSFWGSKKWPMTFWELGSPVRKWKPTTRSVTAQI